MKSWNKEVMGSQLQDEAEILARLKDNYGHASAMISKEIDELAEREQTQSVIYQKQYKENLKANIDAIIDEMSALNEEDISDYLLKQYGQGHVGAMYSLQKQGVPLAFGVNQQAALKATRMTGDGMKLSKKLYKSATEPMKKEVVSEISRGFASGMHVSDIARNVQNRCNVSYNRAARIARTEGGRVHSAAQYDAMKKAKESGADIVKQWNAALDSRTRETHAKMDGQVREIDEEFESPSGASCAHPHGFGIASEDINCRCAVNERARWALDEAIEKLVKQDGQYELVKFDTSSYKKFKSDFFGWSAAHEAPSKVVDSNLTSLKSLANAKEIAESLDKLLELSSAPAHFLDLLYEQIGDVTFTSETNKPMQFYIKGVKKKIVNYIKGKGYDSEFTFIHELAHAVSWSKGKNVSVPGAYKLKVKQKLSYALIDDMKKDYDSLVKELMEGWKPGKNVFDAVSDDLKATQSHASDALSALSEGAIKGKWGHQKAYWYIDGDDAGDLDYEKIAEELFANMFSARVSSPEEWAEFQKYFPSTCKKFEKLVMKTKAPSFVATKVDDVIEKVETPPTSEWSKLVKPKYKNPEWDKLVTQAEKEALIDYGGGLFTKHGWYSYGDLNMYLRKGTWEFKKEEGLETFKEKAQKQVDLISGALKKNTLDEALVVNRYTNLEFLDGMAIGDVGTLKGFTSTTVKKTLKGSGSSLDTSKPLVHIYIPKGSKVGAFIGDTVNDPYEAEFLINHGVKFKYVKKKGNEVWLEIIDDTATTADDLAKGKPVDFISIEMKAWSNKLQEYVNGLKHKGTFQANDDFADAHVSKMTKEQSKAFWIHKDADGNEKGYLFAKHSWKLNDDLRKGKALSEFDAEDAATIKAMDEVAAANALTEDTNFYRLVGNSFLEDNFGVTFDDVKTGAKSIVGQKTVDKGFMSVSYEFKGNSFQDRPIMLNIKAEKGTHAIWTSNKMDAEVVLGRNNSMEIIGVKGIKHGDHEYLVLDVVLKPTTIDDIAETAAKATQVAPVTSAAATSKVAKAEPPSTPGKTYDLGLKGGPYTLEQYDEVKDKLLKKKSSLEWNVKNGKGDVEKYKQQIKNIDDYIADHQKQPAVKAINSVEPPKYVPPVKPKSTEKYSGIWKDDVTLDDYAELKATGAIKKKMSNFEWNIKQGKTQYIAKKEALQKYIDDGEAFLKGEDPAEVAAKKAAAEKAKKEAAEKAKKEAEEKAKKEAEEKALQAMLAKEYDMGIKGGPYKLEQYDEVKDKLKKKKSSLEWNIKNGKDVKGNYAKQLAALEAFEEDYKKVKGKLPGATTVDSGTPKTATSKVAKGTAPSLPTGYKSHEEVLDKLEELKVKKHEATYEILELIDQDDVDDALDELSKAKAKLATAEPGGFTETALMKKIGYLEEFINDYDEYQTLTKYIDDVAKAGVDPSTIGKAVTPAVKAVELPKGYKSAADALNKMKSYESPYGTSFKDDAGKTYKLVDYPDLKKSGYIDEKMKLYDEKIAAGETVPGKPNYWQKKKDYLKKFVDEGEKYDELKSIEDDLKEMAKAEKAAKEAAEKAAKEKAEKEAKEKAEKAAKEAFKNDAESYAKWLEGEGKAGKAALIRKDPETFAGEIKDWVATQGPFNSSAYDTARRDACKLPKTAKTADGKLRARCGEVWRNATDAMRRAINHYTGGGYKPMNRTLRGKLRNGKSVGPGNVPWDEHGSWVKNAIKHMTEIIDRSSYDFDVKLRRGEAVGLAAQRWGVDPSVFNLPEDEMEKALVGLVGKDEAFLSCGSADDTGFSGGIDLRIYCPAGTKMMYAEPFSIHGSGHGLDWDGVTGQSYFGTELETILQRGTVLKIRSVKREGRRIVIECDVVGQDTSTYVL